MNIDVRNIKGDVLKNMNILLKQGFSSTAKATRYVIEKHFELLKTIENKDVEICNLKKEIAVLKRNAKNDNEFREFLKRYINQ